MGYQSNQTDSNPNANQSTDSKNSKDQQSYNNQSGKPADQSKKMGIETEACGTGMKDKA